MQESGQLFTRQTQAIFFNAKISPIQRMLDFDFLCGACCLVVVVLFCSSPRSRTRDIFGPAAHTLS